MDDHHPRWTHFNNSRASVFLATLLLLYFQFRIQMSLILCDCIDLQHETASGTHLSKHERNCYQPEIFPQQIKCHRIRKTTMQMI